MRHCAVDRLTWLVRATGAPSEREFGDGRCDPASFVCGLQTAEVDDVAPMPWLRSRPSLRSRACSAISAQRKTADQWMRPPASVSTQATRIGSTCRTSKGLAGAGTSQRHSECSKYLR